MQVNRPSVRRRLESWKEIAAYLRVSVRTVQRWEEQSALPVHRLLKDKAAGVFAYTDELDEWTSARVLLAEDAPKPAEFPAGPPAEGEPRERQRNWWPWGLAAAACLVALGIYWARSGPGRQEMIGPLRTERVTVSPGLEAQVDVSPAGDRIAFAWYQDGQQGIGIQDIASGVVQRITAGVAPEYSPQWSPDGRKIAFLRHLGGITSNLMLYDGDQVQRIDSITGPDWQDTFRAGPFLQWLPDGNSILAPGCVLRRTSCWVEAIELETKLRRRVAETNRPIFGIALSPQPRKLGLVLVEGRLQKLYTTSLNESWKASGPLEPLYPGKHSQFALNWMPDGRAVFLASPVEGSPSETAVSVPEIRIESGSGTQLVLLQHAGPNVGFDLSRDGRIYWTVVPFDTSMRFFDPQIGGFGNAICDSTSMERFPRLSPDGRSLAFVTNREGVANIAICDLENQQIEYVTRRRVGAVWGPDWSPDGKALAFSMNEPGEASRIAVWRRGEAIRKLTPTSFIASEPAWAPDGASIFFIGSSDGTRRIYSVSPSGESLRDLGETRASEIVPRRDGRLWLREAGSLILWDLSAGQRQTIAVKGAVLRGLDQDGLGAYLNLKVEQGIYGLEGWVYREGQAPRKLTPHLPRVMGWHYTPTGRSIGVVHEEPQGDVYRSEPVP